MKALEVLDQPGLISCVRSLLTRTPIYPFLFLMLGTVASCSQESGGDHTTDGSESRVVQLGPEGDRTDLFLHDDHLVAETRGLTLTPGTIRKHPGNPILVKDKPWEVGNLNYTCVMQDREEGTYKMWYQVIRPKEGGGNESWCMYATSNDGFQWEKPTLGIVEFRPARARRDQRDTLLLGGEGLCRSRSGSPLQHDAPELGFPRPGGPHGKLA